MLSATPRPGLMYHTDSLDSVMVAGAAARAVSLAGNIRHCFEIPVKVVQTNDGFF
jgi:hypothetical protein